LRELPELGFLTFMKSQTPQSLVAGVDFKPIYDVSLCITYDGRAAWTAWWDRVERTLREAVELQTK
jgi:hypothetical protein